MSQCTSSTPLARQRDSTRGVLTATTESGLDPVTIASERYGAAYPDADVAAIQVHLLLINAGSELQQTVSRFLNESGFKMTGPRYSLLRLLYLTPEHALPQGEIARSLNVTSANVTQLIDGLERDGLVERVVSAPDRRVTLARLTPEGEKRCAEMIPAMISLMEETCAMFTEEEKAQLIELLWRFRREVRRRYNLRERPWPAKALDPEANS